MKILFLINDEKNDKPMKLLITGGAGFIGSAVISLPLKMAIAGF